MRKYKADIVINSWFTLFSVLYYICQFFMIFLLVLKVDILILINNRPPTCLALIWVSVWMDARPQFSARARGMLSNASAYDLNTRTEQFWTALWHHNVNNGERWIEIENDKIVWNSLLFLGFILLMSDVLESRIRSEFYRIRVQTCFLNLGHQLNVEQHKYEKK